ncbi:hypothetical protein A6U98_11290 [Rhizobium sp. WYCCWR10014]|nr:hypothetical protein A6U98_11290 [Rhizobium sp. WYCCWR10014]
MHGAIYGGILTYTLAINYFAFSKLMTCYHISYYTLIPTRSDSKAAAEERKSSMVPFNGDRSLYWKFCVWGFVIFTLMVSSCGMAESSQFHCLGGS